MLSLHLSWPCRIFLWASSFMGSLFLSNPALKPSITDLQSLCLSFQIQALFYFCGTIWLIQMHLNSHYNYYLYKATMWQALQGQSKTFQWHPVLTELNTACRAPRLGQMKCKTKSLIRKLLTPQRIFLKYILSCISLSSWSKVKLLIPLKGLCSKILFKCLSFKICKKCSASWCFVFHVVALCNLHRLILCNPGCSISSYFCPSDLTAHQKLENKMKESRFKPFPPSPQKILHLSLKCFSEDVSDPIIHKAVPPPQQNPKAASIITGILTPKTDAGNRYWQLKWPKHPFNLIVTGCRNSLQISPMHICRKEKERAFCAKVFVYLVLDKN